MIILAFFKLNNDFNVYCLISIKQLSPFYSLDRILRSTNTFVTITCVNASDIDIILT